MSFNVQAQAPGDLVLEDPEDIQLLMDEFPEEAEAEGSSDANEDFEEVSLDDLETTEEEDEALLSEDEPEEVEEVSDEGFDEELAELGFEDEEDKKKEEGDDLDSLEKDLGQIEFALPEENEERLKEVEKIERIESNNKPKITILEEGKEGKDQKIIFDVGKAERDLLEMAKNMQGKIPNSEWNEIAGRSTSGTYKVMPGDWLWKISKNLFGTGFYYSKIWALNPYITNPHEIEPGMILSFSTGSDNQAPTLDIFKARRKIIQEKTELGEYERFGSDAKPPWIEERMGLMNEGTYFQYSTGDTIKDLNSIGEEALQKEYEVYEPPKLDFAISVPESEYDDQGFDKDSKIKFDYKEGFHLTTFISNNIVQDFGKIESAINEQGLFTDHDTFFVRFDENIDVVAGDKFSVYHGYGEVSHENSDRKGIRYAIAGSFQTIQRHGGLWECKVIESAEVMKRGDRVTVYTPHIKQITKTFNSRIIEAVLMRSYYNKKYPAFGDVVYLDRGRADGVEVGNVFQMYGFLDRGTKRNIDENPTYKNGELTVITVTDNFATAIVTAARRDFEVGDIAVTKTKEEAARVTKFKNQLSVKDANRLSDKAIDELDVELNLDDLNDALLDKADKIQFTEDELAELERQEREKSIITENEKDLRSLERLEKDLESAEQMLNEARLDEDKLLENENLDKIENKFGVDEQESLDELEENFGKRYLDEDLNDKENPYGLTEFDIEEIDELLNNPEAVEEQ